MSPSKISVAASVLLSGTTTVKGSKSSKKSILSFLNKGQGSQASSTSKYDVAGECKVLRDCLSSVSDHYSLKEIYEALLKLSEELSEVRVSFLAQNRKDLKKLKDLSTFLIANIEDVAVRHQSMKGSIRDIPELVKNRPERLYLFETAKIYQKATCVHRLEEQSRKILSKLFGSIDFFDSDNKIYFYVYILKGYGDYEKKSFVSLLGEISEIQTAESELRKFVDHLKNDLSKVIRGDLECITVPEEVSSGSEKLLRELEVRLLNVKDEIREQPQEQGNPDVSGGLNEMKSNYEKLQADRRCIEKLKTLPEALQKLDELLVNQEYFV